MNIFVTGSSRGIGAATYQLLKSRGHAVAGHCSRGTGELVAGDFADPAGPGQAWDAALDRLGGRIDALVNNAGVYEAVADDASDADWRAQWERTLRVNLQASADLCRLAVAHFKTIGGGRIVNVASRAAWRGDSPSHWHYAASKGAMIAMTKSIARGYAADDILAFAVSPGFTASEMTEDYLAGRGGAKIVAEIPLGRVATPEEVAETIRWLATEAPPSSTGSNIDVNGASYVR